MEITRGFNCNTVGSFKTIKNGGRNQASREMNLSDTSIISCIFFDRNDDCVVFFVSTLSLYLCGPVSFVLSFDPGLVEVRS